MFRGICHRWEVWCGKEDFDWQPHCQVQGIHARLLRRGCLKFLSYSDLLLTVTIILQYLFFSMCGIKMYLRCFSWGKEGEYKFDNNLPLSYRVRNQMMTRSLPCWPVSNESKLCTGKYRCDLTILCTGKYRCDPTSTGVIPQFSRQSFFLYVKVVIIPFTVNFCC